MPAGVSPVFGFGPFVLDVADGSLKRDGVAISLKPEQFNLLLALVTNAGRLVEKDVLLKTMSRDIAVEEHNLTKRIFSLRQLLDRNDRSRYIETIPKRGYRFAAPVTTTTFGRTDSPGWPGRNATTIENSIAVMPFSDMSASRDHALFCERVSEAIVTALGRLADVRVAPYTSSQRFKGKESDPQTIGRELKVSWLLEGSVRKAGEMLRIAVQVVRTSDGFSAWTGRFDGRMDDLFTIQEGIVAMIVRTVTRRW